MGFGNSLGGGTANEDQKMSNGNLTGNKNLPSGAFAKERKGTMSITFNTFREAVNEKFNGNIFYY